LARLYFGGAPGSISSSERALRLHTGADAGLTYELSARSTTSLYFSGAAGFQLLRYEGQLRPDDRSSLEEAMKFGLALSGRVGVRFFRPMISIATFSLRATSPSLKPKIRTAS